MTCFIQSKIKVHFISAEFLAILNEIQSPKISLGLYVLQKYNFVASNYVC
jgi:hypothetical protein